MPDQFSYEDTTAKLDSAKQGFDYLFENQIAEAKQHFTGKDDPFHLLGLGVCSFMEAALGMEAGLMAEASQLLALAETGAKKHFKSSKPKAGQRFAPGLEWEILTADAVVLLGLTHALSESYMGYLQCLYALNSAHSKFTKLYKTVFPTGLDTYFTPATSPLPSRKASSSSLLLAANSHLSSASSPALLNPESQTKKSSGFFSRFTSSAGQSRSPTPVSPSPPSITVSLATEDGPIEELILAGTAFGFGLFNLVFSLLPKKIQGVVGIFGFKADRKLALQALAVAADKNDVHSVFAGLVLMTYHGVVLLLSGYQADEQHILKQYKAVVDKIESKYPDGALWILNRAKILRMSNDAEAAIKVLESGLKPNRPHSFAQADTLLIFELAWTLLAQRRFEEAATMFLKVTEVNSWSHGTYYFLAAGCYVTLGNLKRAQELFDAIPGLIDAKKLTGKDLPTEVFIKKKIDFYKQKQRARNGDENMYVEAMKISPAEELGLFWNTHNRVSGDIAEAHIKDWLSLTPAPTISSPYAPSSPPSSDVSSSQLPDLDTGDELAIRSLLLGIVHRTAVANGASPSLFTTSREFLMDAYNKQATENAVKVSTWIAGLAMFELAVLDLKVAERELDGVDASESANESKNADSTSPAATPSIEVTSETMSVMSTMMTTSTTTTTSTTLTATSITTTSASASASTSSSTFSPTLGTKDKPEYKTRWAKVLKEAEGKLDKALSFAMSATDLSSRLDSRIAMLRDEIGIKRELVGLI